MFPMFVFFPVPEKQIQVIHGVGEYDQSLGMGQEFGNLYAYQCILRRSETFVYS